MQAEENLVLADRQRLVDYGVQANDLWPTSSETIDAMTQWLDKAEAFANRIVKHEKDLVELRRNALASEEEQGADKRALRFRDKESDQRHEMLTMLVDGLRQFNDPDPAKGAFAAVKRRRELAPTKEEFNRHWQEAIASIAADPNYNGLEIDIVEGLYPIGRDPESKLWEFVHLRTGGVPQRADGKIVPTKETGLVLALIPGGEFLMGTDRPDDETPSTSTTPKTDESPIHEVTLNSFFIGKYEVRQCEWERTIGEASSTFEGASRPVAPITWHQAKAFCEKVGLTLPTEAQWEYACRAGTITRDPVRDWTTTRQLFQKRIRTATYRVGQKAPNAFGLHDMRGGVWEWCEDVYDADFYSKPGSAGPDPISTSGSAHRVLRGGSRVLLDTDCRAAERRRQDPSAHDNFLGFRLAARIP